jgi:Fic family protein
MIIFSYVLVPNLKKELENIEKIKTEVILEQIPPAEEISLKFESKIENIISNLKLSGHALSKKDVEPILAVSKERRKNDTLSKVLQYKEALDYIKRNWQLSEENITDDAIYELIKIQNPELRIRKNQISEVLEFISVSPEHPVIKSALAYILIYPYLPEDDAFSIAGSISGLFLYKYGYDFREMINFEEYFSQDIEHLKNIISGDIEKENISAFLLYFVQSISIQAEKVLEKIKNRKGESRKYKLNDLTDRQRRILSLFEIPGVKITNRIVQKKFNVSQVTASRDLARLFALGTIFLNGKGRSVYYTKL